MSYEITCFDYGSNDGCNDGCPVLWEGNCTNPEEVLEMLEPSEEIEEELLDLYGLQQQEDYKSIW